MLLTLAGNATTRNAASGGMLAFFEHPDQWRRLVGDPALAASAAEEIVRWVSPVNLFRRTAIRDTELGGQKIADGDKVVMFYASANRHEDVFAAPQEFDIGRTRTPCRVRRAAFLPRQAPGRARATGTAAGTGPADARHLTRRPGQQAPVKIFVNGIKHMPVRFAAADRG